MKVLGKIFSSICTLFFSFLTNAAISAAQSSYKHGLHQVRTEFYLIAAGLSALFLFMSIATFFLNSVDKQVKV